MWFISENIEGFTPGKSYYEYKFNKISHDDGRSTVYKGKYYFGSEFNQMAAANNAMVKRLKNQKKKKETIYIVDDNDVIRPFTENGIRKYFTYDQEEMKAFMKIYLRDKTISKIIN